MFNNRSRPGRSKVMLARLAHPAYTGAAWLFAILIPAQFFFAGTGMFSNTGFSPHVYLGLVLHAISGALILFAVIGGLPRRALEYGVLQFVLIGMQVVLVRVASPSATISIEPQFVSNLIMAALPPIHHLLPGNARFVGSGPPPYPLPLSAGAPLSVPHFAR